MFCILLGRFGLETFWTWDVCSWDVLYLGCFISEFFVVMTFCLGTFCRCTVLCIEIHCS